ncbi:MAG: adenylate/guanylate cyclase domain-containing protein, partial [Ilumatobacter sp.]
DRQPDIPDLGRDEFGDLARRLGNMAEDLGEREATLAAEFEERRALLLSVLPPRLVDEAGVVSDGGSLADVATVIAVAVDSDVPELRDDEDRVADLLDQVAAFQGGALSAGGIERVRASADNYMYVAGMGSDQDGAAEALAFITEQLRLFADLKLREDVEMHLRVGIATGAVSTGVLDGGSLTFGAWGLPVRQAAALSAMSAANRVLVDASTVAALPDSELFVEAQDVVALDGEPMNLFTLADPVD